MANSKVFESAVHRARWRIERVWPVPDRQELRRRIRRLPPADRARLNAIAHPQSAIESLQATILAYRSRHWLLRGVGVSGDVEIVWTTGGRPRFLGGRAGAADLNLSHGGGWVAVAFSANGAIGIDVEGARRLGAALMADVLVPIERRWVAGARTQPGREARFARLWTLKESLLKCVGLGLTVDPREIAFDCAGSQPRLVHSPWPGNWRHWSFELPGGASCSICQEMEPMRITSAGSPPTLIHSPTGG